MRGHAQRAILGFGECYPVATYLEHLPFAWRPTGYRTIRFMFDVGDSLREALNRGRSELRDAQSSLARANAGLAEGRSADLAMAQTARAAIFTETVLAAMRARFEAIKGVTK
jgi:hypothetical protein